ncbi:hypothetical protein CAEBREN_13968 [Caenorhabditis brenneri]|uniref:Uncharacterized protein n=1 Tax=Caenorhabditis brenneri TaxID=135651 RepID=G0N811_CAEBE|nr:hypothetical protein CAEBREN_13968 [Caenorhabditis brenneri]
MSGAPPPYFKMHLSVSDHAMCIFDTASYFLTSVGLIYLLFSAQFLLFGAVLVSLIFIVLILTFLRIILIRRERLVHLKQFRNCILIGSAVTTILSTVPRVLVYYLVPENTWLLWYICLTFPVTIALTWYIFVNQLKDRCEIFYELDDTLLGYVNYANLILFFYGIFSSFNYTEGFWQILLCQAWFSVIGAASMAEFRQVARWKIRLIPEVDPNILEEVPYQNSFISSHTQEMPGEPQRQLEMNLFVSDLAMTIFGIASYFLTPLGLIYLLFSAQFLLFGAVLVSLVFIVLTFAFFQEILIISVRPIYLRQFRIRILIGSAVATILSTVPRVLVYFLVLEKTWLLWYICLTFPVTIALTCNIFVNQLKDRCETFYESDDIFLKCVNKVNLMLFLNGIHSSFRYTEGFWQILLCQAWFSFIGAASMAQLCQVARWKIKLIPEVERRIENVRI